MVNKMNDAIGVKGDRRYRKRTILITSKNKKKLKENFQKKKALNLKKLEKEVNNIELASFLVAVPISIAGNTIETILTLRDNNKTELEETKTLQTEELHTANKLELKETSIYIEDFQLNDRKFRDFKYPKTIEGKEIVKLPNEKKENIKIKTAPKLVHSKISLEENNKKRKASKKLESNIKVDIKIKNQQEIPILKESKENIKTIQEFKKITDKKLVSQYEEKLTETKLELKRTIYEYNVLEQKQEKIKDKEEANDLLYQLSIIIKKLEELKSKLKVDMTELENDTYLKDIIDNYIAEFKNKNIIPEVKDSELYIMVSDKLDQIIEKVDNLSKKVEDKKELLELDEDALNELKEAYYNYDNFNNQLMNFQYEQDYLLKELEQKIKESATIQEQVRYQVELMNNQSKRLLQILALPMLIPGNRSAKAIATGTAAYLYFMKNLLNPKLRRKRFRIISVTDYSKEIENNISKIEDATNMIRRSSSKLEDMIKKLEIDFKDYIDKIPECKDLLTNLNRLLEDLKEKEKELEKNKKEQEKLLETNNQKVKTLPKTEAM